MGSITKMIIPLLDKIQMDWAKTVLNRGKKYTEEDMIAFAKRFLASCQKDRVTPYQLELYNKEKENG